MNRQPARLPGIADPAHASAPPQPPVSAASLPVSPAPPPVAPAADARVVTDGHDLARGAVANAAVLLAANFRGVFTFLIARLFGGEGLGRFSLMFAVVDALSKVATLGFDQAIVPLVARAEGRGDRGASRQLFARALWLGVGASFALLAVAWPIGAGLAGRWDVEAFTHGGLWMLAALPGIAVARISTGVSRGLLGMRDEFYSRGLGETWITTGVFALAVALGVRDAAPAVAVAVGSLGGACIAAALAHRRLGPAPAPATAPALRGMLDAALPMSGASLLNNLALRTDVLLLGAYVGRAPGVTLESFGVFCAAVEIAGGLRKVRLVFDPILAPVATRRHVSDSSGSLRQMIAGPGRWVLAGQLPAVGFMALAAAPLLSIYGPEFRAGALWLGLLAAAHAANSFAGLVETLLMIERPGLNFLNALVTVIVQIVVSIFLIPVLGVLGAVVGMSTGFAVQGVLRFVELKHVFGWSWPWQSLVRPLQAFALAMLPALGLRLVFGSSVALASALLFAACYCGAWALLGADPADRAVWRRLLKRE